MPDRSGPRVLAKWAVMRRLGSLLLGSLALSSLFGACAPGLASGDDGGAGAGPEDGAGGRGAGGRSGSTGGTSGSGGERASGGSAGATAGAGGRGSGGLEPACGAGCPKGAECVVLYDSAFCECEGGFEEDEGECVDIDECAEDPCGENAVCENSRGSYECTCAEGYVGDGETCSPRVRLVSSAPSGEPGNRESQAPAISADGRVISFHSAATNLIAGDTNDMDDVYVFDRETGEVSRVSVSSDGVEGNYWSRASSLSRDGRYVVFESLASNLVKDDLNGELDVFRHDRETGETIRVSLAHDGSELNNGGGYAALPIISGDGNLVAFTSAAANLVPDDTNDYLDQFVRDVTAQTTIRVSLASDGSQAEKLLLTSTVAPQISGNGRYVTFVSFWSGFGGEDDSYEDVYRRDLRDSVTHHISYSKLPSVNDGNSANPSISADGRFVVFDSRSSALVEGDTNDAIDVFIRDMSSGAIERVSVSSEGEEGNGWSYLSVQRSVSNDGRYVVFSSQATNLVEGDTNALTDVFVRDRLLKKTIRVSVGPNGEEADGYSAEPSISGDGKFVVFQSTSRTFGIDTDGVLHVWVRDLSP